MSDWNVDRDALQRAEYTCAIKLRYNAVLFIEHATPFRWDSGAALFGKKELKAMYRYLDVQQAWEYPAELDGDPSALALLYLFIAEALLDEITA